MFSSFRSLACYCFLGLLFYASAQEAAPFFVGSLTSENLAGLFTSGSLSRLKPLEVVAGSSPALAVTGKVTLQPIILEPSTTFRRLQLTFRARVLGDTTWEENPFNQIAPELTEAPNYQVQVKDKNQTRIMNLTFRQHLYSNQWQDYTLLSYLPPAAHSLELSFNPRRAPEFHLSEITFSWRKQDAILHNGDFALGPANYSGWSGMERMGALETDDHGKTVLNTMPNGTFRTEQFPLTAGEKYQLNITWSEQPKELRVLVAFQDQDGKRLKSHTWKTQVPRKNPPPVHFSSHVFRCPEQTATATVLFYSAIVHAIEVLPYNE